MNKIVINRYAVLKVDKNLISQIDTKYVKMDDEILGGFSGSLPKSGSWGKSLKHGVLVVTNRRVIFWDRKIIGNDDMKSFYYSDIRSVNYFRGLFSSHIIVDVLGKNEKFEGMAIKHGKKATEMIKILLTEFKKSQNQRPESVQEDPIEILDRRLATGQISIKDYHNTKKVLLGEPKGSDENTCPDCGTIGSKPGKYCMECGYHLK